MHFHKCTPSALVIGYWRTSVTMWSGCAFFVPELKKTTGRNRMKERQENEDKILITVEKKRNAEQKEGWL